MVRGGFRLRGGGRRAHDGVLSMRDIVRVWVSDGATSELPSDIEPAPLTHSTTTSAFEAPRAAATR